SRRLYVPLPRFADSPGATVLSPAARAHVVCMCVSPGSRTHRGIEFCRPLRGLTSFVCASPRFADSPGDRVLSPAARAHVVCMCLSPGSRTHRGLRFCRPLRGLTSFVCASPPVRGLTGGYGSVARCAGSRRLYVPPPGSRTHRGLRFCRPLRLTSLYV